TVRACPRSLVRFTPESGQIADIAGCPLCATSRHSQCSTCHSPNGIYGISYSLRLDACELDHLAPLLRFVGDEPAKVCGRDDKRRASKVGKPRLDLGIGEGGVNLSVELVDNFHGRGLGNANAKHYARLVAWDELVHGRDVWQPLPASGGR